VKLQKENQFIDFPSKIDATMRTKAAIWTIIGVLLIVLPNVGIAKMLGK